MGWKGTVRGLNAAANRAARESEAKQRGIERARAQALSEVDRSSESIAKKARAFEASLQKDIIKTLNLRFDEVSGFTSKPFEISTPAFEGSLSFAQSSPDDDGATTFEPASFEAASAMITPLRLMLTRWASVIAFQVAHSEDEYRLRTNWLKKSEPRDSPVYLVDVDNSGYYYPLATDLHGEVLPGLPKLGLMAFEPFRKTTRHVQLHFSSVKLSKARGDAQSFHFDIVDEDLSGQIEEVGSQPTVTETVTRLLSEQQVKVAEVVGKGQSGCAFVLVGFVTIAALAVIWPF